MDGMYIMIDGARYKRMQDKRKKIPLPYHTPDTAHEETLHESV